MPKTAFWSTLSCRSCTSGATTRYMSAGQSRKRRWLHRMPLGRRGPKWTTGASRRKGDAMLPLAELVELDEPAERLLGGLSSQHPGVTHDDQQPLLATHRDAEPVLEHEVSEFAPQRAFI